MGDMTVTNGAAKPATAQSQIAAYVKSHKHELEQAAAPGVDLKRLYRLVLTCMTVTPALSKCTTTSIFRCMQQAAELALTPGSALGECYLIPFYNNQEKRHEAQFLIGYRGFIALARRSGSVRTIQAGVVYQGDHFEVERGLNEKLRHIPAFADSDPSKIIFAYAMARLDNGEAQWDVMTRAEIDRIRARSKSANSGPWVTDFAEMAKKTVVRRMSKLLPMTVEFANVVDVDENNEFGPVEIMAVGPTKQIDTPIEDDITDTPAIAPLVPIAVTQSWQRAGLEMTAEVMTRVLHRTIKDATKAFQMATEEDLQRLYYYSENQGAILPPAGGDTNG